MCWGKGIIYLTAQAFSLVSHDETLKYPSNILLSFGLKHFVQTVIAGTNQNQT